VYSRSRRLCFRALCAGVVVAAAALPEAALYCTARGTYCKRMPCQKRSHQQALTVPLSSQSRCGCCSLPPAAAGYIINRTAQLYLPAVLGTALLLRAAEASPMYASTRNRAQIAHLAAYSIACGAATCCCCCCCCGCTPAGLGPDGGRHCCEQQQKHQL
jgi:hypothetical protein